MPSIPACWCTCIRASATSTSTTRAWARPSAPATGTGAGLAGPTRRETGAGGGGGLVCHPLLEDRRVVVASPELLRRQPLAKPEDLVDHVLLEVSTRPQTWRDWFLAQGLPLRRMQMGPQFEFTAHLIQSVMAGVGIGLVTRLLVEDEIRSGAL